MHRYNVRQMLHAIDAAFGDYALARNIYREYLINTGQGNPRNVPDRRDFQRLDQRFQDFEFVIAPGHRRAGRPRIHWRKEERIIALARAYPLLGLRGIARRVGVSHMTVLRVIREEGLRPYRIRRVQALHHGDRRLRRNFCRWMLRKLERNPQFLQNVVFTDESNFSNTNIQNSQNSRIWAYRNPHAMIERFNQGRFSINVWAGIIGDNIIGPFYLPNSLTGTRYLQFLRSRFINGLRQIVPQGRRRQIYFVHDGAPPHYVRSVREFLSEMFGSRWIGRRPAPHLWPPRSPDLTPLDFFFWGTVKHIVNRSGPPIRTVQQLKSRIEDAFHCVQCIPNIYQKIRKNLKERLKICLRNNGGHIEAGDQARLLRAINLDGSILWQRTRNPRNGRRR